MQDSAQSERFSASVSNGIWWPLHPLTSWDVSRISVHRPPLLTSMRFAVSSRFTRHIDPYPASHSGALRPKSWTVLPSSIRADQGTEFVSRDLDLWAYQRGVTLDFSRPGKLTDNAFIEAFNSRFRAECLNAHWFLSLADARKKMEDWRKYYNEERPHGAIGQMPPIMLLTMAQPARHGEQTEKIYPPAIQRSVSLHPQLNGSASSDQSVRYCR